MKEIVKLSLAKTVCTVVFALQSEVGSQSGNIRSGCCKDRRSWPTYKCREEYPKGSECYLNFMHE